MFLSAIDPGLRPLARRFAFSVGVLVVVLLAGALPPGWIEAGYSRGLYPWLHRVVSSLFGFLPVPGLYVLLVLFLVETVLNVRRIWRKPRRWLRLALSGANVVIWMVILFQLLWGLNYRREPVAHRLGLTAVVPDTAQLRLLAEEAVDSLNVLSLRVFRIGEEVQPSGQEEFAIPFGLCKVLEALGYPCIQSARVRLLQPQGVLLRIGTAGFYLPYSGEGHIDAGLHPLQRPFVMAHELAHAEGFGDEGVCNFWAWLTTTRASDPFVAYSGWLSWWAYLSAEMRYFAPDVLADVRARLAPTVRADLQAIDEQMDLFPDLFPALRNWIYHHYLLAQGVDKGLDSYGQMVGLVVAFRQKEGALPSGKKLSPSLPQTSAPAR